MLTTLEANFVQEYKLNGGNAKQAVLKAGYKASPKNASCIGSRLIRNPKISHALSQVEARQLDALSQPFVKQPPAQVMLLPSKEEYALKAWQRSSDESRLKDDTKFKYYDLAGKVLGHVNDSDSNNQGDIINIICRDLKFSIGDNTSLSALEEKRASIINQSQMLSTSNIVDISNNSENVVEKEGGPPGGE